MGKELELFENGSEAVFMPTSNLIHQENTLPVTSKVQSKSANLKNKEKTMTVKEIAEIKGVSESSVKRAIRKLFAEKMQNGKTTFLNEKEVAAISAELKGEYHTSQLTYSAGEQVKNTVKEKTVTTRELAETLGVSTETIRATAKKIITPSKLIWRVINGGNSLVFNEEQSTAIKIELQNHSKIASNGFNTMQISNDLEMLLLSQKLADYQNKRIAELQKENEQQKMQLIEQAPKVEFYDDVTGSKDTIDMSEVAKVLNCGLGRNRIFELLRNKHILQSDNQPYQKYVDTGYFRTIESRYTAPNGDIKISIKTVVLQRGLDFIRKLIKENK